jgi:hypothetical protein
VEKEKSSGIRGLLKRFSADPEKLKLLEEAVSRLEEACGLLDKTMKELRIYDLASLYEELKGCSEEYTLVYNSAKKSYYYWYLKCTGNHEKKSIYLGKSPTGYNTLRDMSKVASDVLASAERFRDVVGELTGLLRDFAERLSQLRETSVAEAEDSGSENGEAVKQALSQ